jgi:hypothetical protein
MPSLNTGNAILSNPIKVDSSYNVGIGGAASGSYKLQVTGTTNLTGALTGTTGTFSGLDITSASASPVGLTITGGDETFVKFIGPSGVKNWGFITTNLAGSDFGIYQSTSAGGDPFSAGTPKLYFNGDGAATFSSSVTSNNRFVADTNTTSPSDGSAYFYKSSAGAVVSGYQFIAETGGAGSRATRLTIDNTGAAIFSSFVFADSFGATGNNTMSSWGASPVRPIIEGREGNALSNYVGLPEMYMTSNAFYNGTAWIRKSANASMNMVMSGYNNNFLVQSAPSGSAGGAVSFSTLFLINGANGNVGIGTTSPAFRLHVVGPTNGVAYISGSSNAYRAELALEGNGQFTGSFVANPSASSTYNGIPTSCVGITTSSTDLVFATTNAERMRISANGVKYFPSSTGSLEYSFNINAYSSGNALANKVSTTAGWDHFYFQNPNGNVGSISTSGSSTSYFTSSDYRLKQDLKDYNGLNLVSAIKTYDYEWKVDNTRAFGVLAHELQEVLPQAVNGEKDGEKMQGVDYSKIVPVLVKAIQEMNQTIQNQQQQINSLINR